MCKMNMPAVANKQHAFWTAQGMGSSSHKRLIENAMGWTISLQTHESSWQAPKAQTQIERSERAVRPNTFTNLKTEHEMFYPAEINIPPAQVLGGLRRNPNPPHSGVGWAGEKSLRPEVITLLSPKWHRWFVLSKVEIMMQHSRSDHQIIKYKNIFIYKRSNDI